MLLLFDKLEQFLNFHRRFRVKQQEDLTIRDADLLHQKLFEHTPEIHHSKQIFDYRRGRPEAITNLLFELGKLQRIGYACEAFVKEQTLIGVRDIVFRKISGNLQADLGLHFRRHEFAFKLADGLLHHFRVELEPYGGNLARLLLTQKITRTANLKIMQRELKAAAESVQFLERPQPPLGVRRDYLFARDQQVSIGMAMGAADPSP